MSEMCRESQENDDDDDDDAFSKRYQDARGVYLVRETWIAMKNGM